MFHHLTAENDRDATRVSQDAARASSAAAGRRPTQVFCDLGYRATPRRETLEASDTTGHDVTVRAQRTPRSVGTPGMASRAPLPALGF
jgi:hypothetical protein